MTRTKHNHNVSAANGDKRKGGNGNTNSKEVARTLRYNKSNGEPKLIKIGQTLKEEKRNGKGIHGKRMVTQIKSIRKRARGLSPNLLSHTPKRNIADPDFVEKETSNGTRELVLPSDSNIVKGNV
jgi:hypothetical protein